MKAQPHLFQSTLALSASTVCAALMAGCGGSSSSNLPSTQETAVAAIASCYDGTVDNVIGNDDPFAVNTWALKNTGPEQVVSARTNPGLAGIDAKVEAVHQGGKGCTGKGVTIAIVDDGLETTHEDLAPNVLLGRSWDFASNSNNPNPSPKTSGLNHGTAVAGVAAAKGWNGKGSRGMAPNASLVSFAVVSDSDAEAPLSDFSFPPSYLDYLRFGARARADATDPNVALFGDRADSVHIFNLSGGYNFAALVPLDDILAQEEAARWGTANLRGGKGALYFQSAGNEFEIMRPATLPDTSMVKTIACREVLKADRDKIGGTLSRLDGISCGNTNLDPFSKPYFFQVAALNNRGVAASYSSAGASNWISGFGGEFGTDEPAMITTDNSGCDKGLNNRAKKGDLLAGLQNSLEALARLIADLFGEGSSKDPQCNYTGRMNGTSSAAPSVSGVAALILEANPKLTWQDVGYILAKTARKVDANAATGAQAVTFRPTGGTKDWVLDDPWITNQAGFNFQSRYGFGMVDADAAVRLAIRYAPPSDRRSSELQATGPGSSSAVQDSVVGVHSSTVSFSQTGSTGPMRVEFELSNNTDQDINPGQLQFVLTHASTGTRSILLPPFTALYAGHKNFPLVKGGKYKFRLHTNAFFGESLAGGYKLEVIDFSGASGVAGKTLSFTPKLTSFSM